MSNRKFRIMSENFFKCGSHISDARELAKLNNVDAFIFNNTLVMTNSGAQSKLEYNIHPASELGFDVEIIEPPERNTSQQRFATDEDMLLAAKAWLDYDSGMKVPMKDAFIDGYLIALKGT